MTKVWGYALWLFLHTTAEKIKEEEFDKHKDFFIGIISNLCSLLPCPSCEKDAIQYMKGFPSTHIKTRDDFKMYIFHFHNHVNRKIGKPLFKVDELKIYETFSYSDVIVFFKRYFVNHKAAGLDLCNGMNRRMRTQSIFQYMGKNYTIFKA